MKPEFPAIIASLAVTLAACASSEASTALPAAESGRVVAYVTSWSDVIPDPTAMTHINYAFGHVSEGFDSVGISNPERLKQIAALKSDNPDLSVMLSIGGWGSGRFSEMAADSLLRSSFAKDCRRVVDEYGLDGIDIDWEYPGSNAAGISSSPADRDNFTLLMRDIRKAIGDNKLLTLAGSADGRYINFVDVVPYLDFVNIMSYDMASAPGHHSALYAGDVAKHMTTDAAVRAHINAGVPPSMIVVGMPFYGRGKEPFGNFCDYGRIQCPDGYTERWDSLACVPYIADEDGNLVLGYDNPTSIAGKCEYIKQNGLGGAMYWDYAGDDAEGSLRNAVKNGIMCNAPSQRVLVINEGHGQHEPFTRAAMEWLRNEAKEKGYAVNEINRATPITQRLLQDYDCVIQLDYPPYTWPEYSQEAFIDYIDNGKGGWIGFHHATLLGEFDGYPMWDWFSDFMGGVRFQNYIAPLADGNVIVEDTTHPVMAGVDPEFVLEDDEWYTYDKSPRSAVHVIANVDEDSYSPASDIKMGDHPVVWTNPSKKARNVYFQFGHSPKLLENPQFTKMLGNAIDWTLNEKNINQ